MGTKARGVLPSFEAVKSTAASVGKGAATATGAVLGLGVAFTAAAAAAAGGLVGAGGAFALDMMKFREQTELSFKYAEGSGAAADKTFGYATRIAATLGQSAKDVAGQLGDLFSKGFGADEAEKLVQMMADIRTINGKVDPTPLADAVMGLKKNQALTVEALAPLKALGKDASEKLFSSLADSLGIKAKTAQERQKLVEAKINSGGVKGQQGMNALSKAFLATTQQKKAGDVTKTFADTTLTGGIGKLKGNLDTLFAAASTGGGAALIGIVQKLAGALDPASERGGKVAAVIGKIGAAAGRVLGKLNFNTLLGIFDKLLAAVDPVIDAFESFGGGVMTGINEAAGTVGELLDMLGSGSDGASDSTHALGEALSAVGTALGYIVVGIGAGIAAFGWLAAKVAGVAVFLVGTLGSLGMFAIEGFIDGWDKAKGKLFDRIKQLGALIPESLRKVLGIHSPSTVFAQIGRYTMQGYQQGVEKEQDRTRDVTFSVVRPDVRSMLASGPGGRAGAGGSVTLTINQEIHGEGARDIAAETRRAATEAIDEFVQQIGMQLGTVGAAP
jgi:hypothetical protein